MKRFYNITPVSAPRMTKQDKWRQRPCVMRYKVFGQAVRLARVEIPQPCRIVFYLPMPKSWSKADKGFVAGSQHCSKPDLDNLLKGLLDAVYYKQGDADKRIWSVWAEKRWANGLAGFTIEELERRP